MSEEQSVKKRLPLKPGMFEIPDDPNESPYLVAGKCGQCGTFFYPQRTTCLNCGAEDFIKTRLKGTGTVYTFTIARQQLPGAFVKVPYAIAIISMDEGCQIHTVITEDWENVDVGMPVEAYYEVMIDDPDGNDRMAYKFRAVK